MRRSTASSGLRRESPFHLETGFPLLTPGALPERVRERIAFSRISAVPRFSVTLGIDGMRFALRRDGMRRLVPAQSFFRQSPERWKYFADDNTPLSRPHSKLAHPFTDVFAPVGNPSTGSITPGRSSRLRAWLYRDAHRFGLRRRCDRDVAGAPRRRTPLQVKRQEPSRRLVAAG